MGVNLKVKVPKVLKSVRYTLAGVNCVFLLTGLLLFAVGVGVLITFSNYDEMITKRFFNIPRFAIATGVIIMLTSVLGFYAAVSESFIFIAGYVVLTIVVLVFEISLMIAAFALEADPASSISATMRTSLQQYSTRLETAQLWDDLQTKYECCGVAGRFDYISNQIPISCCHIDYGTISPFECGTANSHPTGCAAALADFLSYNAHVMAVCALVVTCIQVVLSGVSGWLAWRSKFETVELES